MASTFLFGSLLGILLLFRITDARTSLLPAGEVKVCSSESHLFTCQVTFDGTSRNRLQWRVHFSDSLSQHDIRQIYIPNDPVGESHRNRDIFVFTLTSSSSLGLNSTLMVNDFNNSYSHLINGTTVTCSQGNESDSQQAMLEIINGAPIPPTDLKYSIQATTGYVVLQWNSSDAIDNFTISIHPPVGSQSVFTTSITSIHLPLLYNQEYSVSVVASNCAGNSTPAEMIFRIGYCARPVVGPWVGIEGNESGLEGSQVIFRCKYGLVPIKPVVSNCTNEVNPNMPVMDVEETLTFISDTCSTSEWSSIKFLCSNGLISNLTMTSNSRYDHHAANHNGDNHTAIPHNHLLLQTSLASLSAFLFLLGILFGVLFTKCAQKIQARNKPMAPVVPNHALMPIYEEVPVKPAVDNTGVKCKVEDNVAYGPIIY